MATSILGGIVESYDGIVGVAVVPGSKDKVYFNRLQQFGYRRVLDEPTWFLLNGSCPVPKVGDHIVLLVASAESGYLGIRWACPG